MKNLLSDKSRNILKKLFTLDDEKLFTFKNSEEKPKDFKGEYGQLVDFDTAIAATGFGKFNIIMLLISMPAGWTAVFDTGVMSFVFPAAQCDLNLTLVHKGTLNAIIYAGMISSAFLWGYVADTLGRKRILLFGYMLDALCNFCCSFAQTYWMLILFKYINGFIVSGPLAVQMAYLSEFHSKKIRSRIIISTGFFFSSANIILPLLALWIIPQPINFTSKYIDIHSWNILILITSIPAFIAGAAYIYLPESPKFLMTTGRNEEALKVFRRVYAMNTGKDPSTYPIASLIEEVEKRNEEGKSKITAGRGWKLALKEGIQQLKPLFCPPYLGQFILIVFMYFILLMSMNTLRLWLPQIFVAMDHYEQEHNNSGNTSLCTMIDYSLTHRDDIDDDDETGPRECIVSTPNAQVYINSVIVAMCTLVGYMICTLLVEVIGKKLLIFVLLVIGGTAGLLNYWSKHWIETLVFSSMHVSLIGIACTTVITAIVEIFPTEYRAMAISLTMMCGRTGSITGNLMFPYLLQLGCFHPFMLIGGTVLACSFLCLGIRTTTSTNFR